MLEAEYERICRSFNPWLSEILWKAISDSIQFAVTAQMGRSMRLLGERGVIVSPREGEQEEGSFSQCMIVVTGMNKHQQRDTVQIIVKKIILWKE